MVGGGRGEGDQPSSDEDRNDEGHVGSMTGPGIGVVVHDDVARPDRVAALGEQPLYAADIAGDRA